VNFSSYASGEFWEAYRRLPAEVQRAADKQFALFQQNPSHPSLHLKSIGLVWSARVTRAYRALAFREGDVALCLLPFSPYPPSHRHTPGSEKPSRMRLKREKRRPDTLSASATRRLYTGTRRGKGGLSSFFLTGVCGLRAAASSRRFSTEFGFAPLSQ